MAIHSNILAWRIPWTEEPSRLQSMGSERVGHDWATGMHPHEEKQTAGLGCGYWGEGSQYASVTVRCCSLHAPHLCSDPAWHLLLAAPPFLMRGSRLCTVLPAAEHPGRGLCPCLGPSAQLSLLKAEFPSCHPELRGAGNLARCRDATGRNGSWHSRGAEPSWKGCGWTSSPVVSCGGQGPPVHGLWVEYHPGGKGSVWELNWGWRGAAAAQRKQVWRADQGGSPAPRSPLLPSLSGMLRGLAAALLWTHFEFTLQVTSTFSKWIDFRLYLRIYSGWRFLSDKIVWFGESEIHAQAPFGDVPGFCLANPSLLW